MWLPGVETVKLVPVVQPPPSEYSVVATPEPPESAAAKVSVTGLACQASSAPETVVVGGAWSAPM